jgi:hypothetical protein
MILQIYTIGPSMIRERFRAIMQTFRAALIASKAISKPTPFTWTQPEPAVWAAIWLCAGGSPPGARQPATWRRAMREDRRILAAWANEED